MRLNKLKKLGCFLGMMALTVSMAACGEGGASTGKTSASASQPSSQAKQSEKTETSEKPAPTETQKEENLSVTEKAKKDLNFNGEEIVFCYPPGYGMINEDGTNQALVRRDKKLEELAKKYNFKLVQRDDAATYWENMVTSISTGKPEGHIMVTQDAQVLDWAKAGALADLTVAMQKTGIDFKDENKYSQLVRVYTNYNGKQYGFCDPSQHVAVPYWFYNKRIFKEMQLEDPNELVKSGKWTWEKVTELAQKATKRNADGTISQYGLGCMMLNDFLSSMCQSNGTCIAGFDDQGNPKFKLAEEPAMKAFQQMADWLYKDKVALFNDGSMDWDATIKNFLNGEVAIFCGTNPTFNKAFQTPMADDFGILPLPKGPDVKDYTIGAKMGQFYFIPKTYENMADKLLLVIDDLYQLEDGMTREDTVSEWYLPRVRDKESLDNYAKMALHYNNIYDTADVSKLAWSDPAISKICLQVVKGEATPADVIEQTKVQFQTLLQDKFTDMKLTGK